MTKSLLFIFLSLIILLGSCSSKKYSDRYREGDNAGQEVALTVEEEKKLTREALAEMKKEYPAAESPELQSYINRIGQKIVNANNLNNKPYTYTFTVVDVPVVNAFAMPAGSVFMTAPIIAMADSEAEIAGVLGHEIGHVTARHTAERMYVAKKEQPKTWIFGGVGAGVGLAAGIFLGSKLCQPKDTACRAKYALGGGAAGGMGGLMVQKYGFMKNSQEDELESDRVGFRYAANAGYDKEKVGDFYVKLGAMEKEAKKGQNAVVGFLGDAMASHPSSDKRVAQAEEMKRLIKTSGGTSSTQEFQQMKRVAQQIVERAKTRQPQTQR
jgi:beta-barrel assembly-enhancing protease